ncbi:MAG TPA: hypothetical protein VMI33_16750 [Streptosporangiaceae bacterium]|nr:hypothetical protein [Streptosporangiaceae bacterium]
MEEASHPALRRVLREAGDPALADKLAALSGTGLTTLLLEVLRRRADLLTPAEVMRRYGSDRFVAPATAGFGAQRRAEDVLLAALPAGFEVLTLAPVLPLGAHSAVATVDPRKVVATIRGSEVAADPTNGLALEAAARRRRARPGDPRAAAPVRLAATQRVVRAQHVSGPVSFAHFQLLGLVTAGRDPGGHAFERESLGEHLRSAVTALRRLGAQRVRVEMTRLDPALDGVAEAVTAALAGPAEVADAPHRESGRGYYAGLCFKVYAGFGGAELEVGDGGFTDWTAKLLGSRKERLLISGYGIDRIAIASGASGRPAQADGTSSSARSRSL